MNHWRDSRDGVPEAQTKDPDLVNHRLGACRSAGKRPRSMCKADLTYHQNMYMCVHIIADSLVSWNCQGRVCQKRSFRICLGFSFLLCVVLEWRHGWACVCRFNIGELF